MPRRAPLLLATLLATGACGGSLHAPPPTVVADVDAPPVLPLSTLNVPVTVDLSPITSRLESIVPRAWGDIGERMQLESNTRVSVAFAIERNPFRVRLDGETARLSAVIHYRVRGWYDPPLLPTVSGSCGTGTDDDDVRPRAVIGVSSRITLTDEWTLRARTRVDHVASVTDEERDVCRITFIRYNVTDRVLDAARAELEKNTHNIDRAIAGVDIRSQFEQWWELLQTPIALTDSLWLVIDPRSVRQGRSSGRGTHLTATVGLAAAPRLVFGRRPDIERRPLPPLDTAAVDDGLHILAEGVIEYGTVNELLQRKLVGRSIDVGGRELRVRDVHVHGIGGGRLALRLVFDGSARGSVYFVGTPGYDAERGELHVPDLDYDLASTSMLVRGFSWLRHDAILDMLREQAHVPVGDALAEASRYLTEGLNRELAPNVRLAGEVLDVRAIGVHATRRAILVHGHATATARLVVGSIAP